MILAAGTIHFLLSDECSHRSILDGISPITVHQAGCMEAPSPVQVEETAAEYPEKMEMTIQYDEESKEKIREALRTTFEAIDPQLDVKHKRSTTDWLYTILSPGSTNSSLEQSQTITLPNIFPKDVLAGYKEQYNSGDKD